MWASIHLNQLNQSNMKANYNKSEILKRAWKLFKSDEANKKFSECLRQSWHIAKNGTNNNTFNQIYSNFNKLIYRYIISKVKRTEIAEELSQEVFVRLHKHFDNYDVYKAKISTWLYTIANNIVIDYYRTDHSDRYQQVSNFMDAETGRETYQFAAPESYETENVMETNEINLKIKHAFQNLKPKYRRIAELYFLEDKKYSEIAIICNIPLGTVKGMINRCREMLQNELINVRNKTVH